MAKEDTLVIHEIYASIQGESTFAGLPCTFVRTTGCNLRCAWCDTPQAFYGGTRMARRTCSRRRSRLETPLVELTGGEPLLQPGVIPLLRELCDAGDRLVETSGEADVSRVDPRVHKIMDLKAPGSRRVAPQSLGEPRAPRPPRDEIKFVLASRDDYECMRATSAIAISRGAPRTSSRAPSSASSRRGTSSRGRSRTRCRCACSFDAQVHLGAGRAGRVADAISARRS